MLINFTKNQAQSQARSVRLSRSWKQEHLSFVLQKEQNLLRGNTKLNFLIFPSCNSLWIREVFLSIKLLCKHGDNCVQMRTQLLRSLSFMNANVEKVCSSSIDSSTNTIIISANLKALLLIVTHNLVTGLVSKGSATAFGT